MARATSDRPRARWVFLRGAEEVFGGEELLRSLLEAAPATILATTPAGRLLFINRLITHSSEALEGRTIYDFTAPRHHADIRACLEHVAATGEPGSYETEGASATGEPAWYESRVAPLFKDGRIAALTIVATDVTARRAAEERLRESEEKLRVAVAATDMGLWSWDAERDAYSWDARMLDIFGLERAPGSVAEYAALVHPDDRDRLNERIAATRQGRSFEPTEYRIRRGDGTLRWVQVRGRVMGDGSVVGTKVMGGTLDVTER
ncbi:MAG: PAS domain S-box protein, partial [Myxococcales bacterium]|nr:PAS domain S-box protein [Myxococcales bacterium]